jgi:cis-3-alkyl-4-acyloxetan-2-one decarboxylase
LGHDWGAYPALKIAHDHPTAVTAVVSEDIGLNSILCPTSILVILAYQAPLVAIFLLSRIVPTSFVASLCRNVLRRCLPWQWCGALGPPLRNVVMRPTYHMYPYFTMYRGMWHTRDLYPVKFTKAPLLYMYGKQKPFMLHSKLYMEKLEQRSDCRSIAYDGAGHWLHTSHPKRMAHDMMQFFQEVVEASHIREQQQQSETSSCKES